MNIPRRQVDRKSTALDDLPDPPEGRKGWPWTEQSDPLPPTLPDGTDWPRLTVVTPSYNQGEFIEGTLRSVLLQGYPNLEYMVIDGGSTDESVEILERYDPWLDHWVSEPDEGQSHAINKGMARASGEVLAWLNSDDTYFPGTLAAVGREMAGGEPDIFIGAMEKTEVHGERVEVIKRSSPVEGDPIHWRRILKDGPRHAFHFIQPPMFWRRWVWEETGGLDERYDWVMDMEWCNRALAAGATVGTTDQLFTRFPLHPGSKSYEHTELQLREMMTMYLRLSVRPEFRFWPCIISLLEPARSLCSHKGAEHLQEGRWMKSLPYRAGLRVLRAVT